MNGHPVLFPTTAWALVPDGPIGAGVKMRLQLELGWMPEAAHEVQLAAVAGRGRPRHWVFDRSLLADAVEGRPAGLGDLSFLPVLDGDPLDPVAELVLSGGGAVGRNLSIPLRVTALAMFLHATYLQVPAGAEVVDVDPARIGRSS